MKTIHFISVLKNISTLLLMFYSIYQLIFFFFAYTKPIKKRKIINKKHRFMAVIAARNEEKVISNLIESLRKQRYPKDKLDIYVIADNCTDSTAEIARKAGAIVYERFNELKMNKGYALEWFFDKVLEEFKEKYDAFCVFDADNLVAHDFIDKMNEKLCEGETIVQGYRDIKNAGDNWLSSNGALYYWTLNRLYHYSRYKMGLSSFIQGTGFMVSMDIIKEENGWHTTALTEDIEFSFTQIAKGKKITWANDAVVYDEQPTDLIQTWNQRLRWGVGNVQVIKKCVPMLLKSKIITPTIIDAFIYLMSLPIVFISLAVAVLNVVQTLALPTLEIYPYFKTQLLMSLVFMIASILQVVFLVKLEKKSIKQVWQGIITYPIFLGILFLVNICSVFNKNLTWKPIAHIKAIKLNELQK